MGAGEAEVGAVAFAHEGHHTRVRSSLDHNLSAAGSQRRT